MSLMRSEVRRLFSVVRQGTLLTGNVFIRRFACMLRKCKTKLICKQLFYEVMNPNEWKRMTYNMLERKYRQKVNSESKGTMPSFRSTVSSKRGRPPVQVSKTNRRPGWRIKLEIGSRRGKKDTPWLQYLELCTSWIFHVNSSALALEIANKATHQAWTASLILISLDPHE